MKYIYINSMACALVCSHFVGVALNRRVHTRKFMGHFSFKEMNISLDSITDEFVMCSLRTHPANAKLIYTDLCVCVVCVSKLSSIPYLYFSHVLKFAEKPFSTWSNAKEIIHYQLYNVHVIGVEVCV